MRPSVVEQPNGRRWRRWHLSREDSGEGGATRRTMEGRVPPGQYLTDDFPVLSAGPTPRTPLEEWSFSITGEVDEPRT